MTGGTAGAVPAVGGGVVAAGCDQRKGPELKVSPYRPAQLSSCTAKRKEAHETYIQVIGTDSKPAVALIAKSERDPTRPRAPAHGEGRSRVYTHE